MEETAKLPMSEVLSRLASGAPLTRAEARGAMSSLLAGESTAAQTGAFLMALRMKGETEEEVTGLVEAMRAASVRIAPGREPLVDLCGTGGDGSCTFNISTAASFVVAGAGAAVAKHGNRSASSPCGSADVLESLGVPINLPPARACVALEEHGFAFLFAPAYHPAMKHVAGPRKELRLRTVFNILGPLANPAGVARQLIGVFDGRLRGLMARVLAALGTARALVVHGEGGLDELSISGPTLLTVLDAGEIHESTVHPLDCGVAMAPLGALRGGEAAANALIIERLLAGGLGPHREAVLLNAAAALFAAGLAADLKEGVARARESIDSGAGRRVLESARSFR